MCAFQGLSYYRNQEFPCHFDGFLGDGGEGGIFGLHPSNLRSNFTVGQDQCSLVGNRGTNLSGRDRIIVGRIQIVGITVLQDLIDDGAGGGYETILLHPDAAETFKNKNGPLQNR